MGTSDGPGAVARLDGFVVSSNLINVGPKLLNVFEE